MMQQRRLSLLSLFVTVAGAATLLLHPASARSAFAQEQQCPLSDCSAEAGCTACSCTYNPSTGWKTCSYACNMACGSGSGGGGQKPGT